MFDILDRNRIGKLSKENCGIENISEEFKFIFGGIFTKLFLKKLVCNKREFTKLCLNVLKELDSDVIFNLLDKLKGTELVSSHILVGTQDERDTPSHCQMEMRRSNSYATVQEGQSYSGTEEKTLMVRNESMIREHKKSLL